MAKYPSQACQLQLSISAVYTTIISLTKISPPDPDVEIVETTDITVAHGKTFDTTGLVDAGDAGGEGYFDPVAATQTALSAYVKAPTANAATLWKLIYSDAAPTNWTWSAIVKKFTPVLEMGQFMKFNFAMKVTGVVTGW